MGHSSLATILLPFALALPAVSAADPLQDDYARLESQRRALEAERSDYETRIEQEVVRLAQRKASWNACVERINYPERVCWEVPRMDASGRERALDRRRGEFEAVRDELENERRRLEAQRREIEALFSTRGRGRAYEGEFRSYMRDTEAYLGKARDRLLKGYGEYLSQVNAYSGFIESQANACPAPKPCEFAAALEALSAQREDVQQQRRELEARLNAALNPDAVVPAMLQAAERLWGQFVQKPPSGAALAALESSREAMEAERADLETQRRAVERQRAAFDRQREALEATRARLERETTGQRRGAEYQQALLAAYVAPMNTLLHDEQKLFENYRDYENAVVLYVYWIRETVASDPEMRSIAQAALAGYSDEFSQLESQLAGAAAGSTDATATVVAAAPTPPAPAASAGGRAEMAALELAEPASVADEAATSAYQAEGQGSVSGTLVGLMRAYVGKIRDNVVSLGQSG